VVKRALELSATAVILVHNHPIHSALIPLDHVQSH
jgi:DNA repair protein RadC